MGDPRKARKKYQTPSHPWQKKRIEEEKELIKEFGFKNKKEIWKLHTWLRNVQRFIKKSVTSTSSQVLKERKELLDKLHSYGLVSSDATLDDVLSLTLRDILNRRLQTLVFKKGFSRTMRQARQFIVHKHVTVDGKTITSPNYLVRAKEEQLIGFVSSSSLNDPSHPERRIERDEVIENKEDKKVDKKENKKAENEEDKKLEKKENKKAKKPTKGKQEKKEEDK